MFISRERISRTAALLLARAKLALDDGARTRCRRGEKGKEKFRTRREGDALGHSGIGYLGLGYDNLMSKWRFDYGSDGEKFSDFSFE